MREALGEIRILYLRELRCALRERSIVVNSIMLPILLYPALLWLLYSGVEFVAGQTERQVSRVMVHSAPNEHAGLERFLEVDEGIELARVDQPRQAIESGELDALLEFRSAVDGRDDPLVRLYLFFDGAADRGRTAQRRLTRRLDEYRNNHLSFIATEAGVDSAAIRGIRVEHRNVTTGREMGSFLLGLIVPMFLIIVLGVGAMYPAVDSTAGEREYSTWETLMTTSVRRSSIVVAKYLYVATMSFMAGMLNMAAMTLSLRAILNPMLGGADSGSSVVLPLASIPVIAAGAALMALFIAAGVMILASFARTFREGQSMIGPFYLVIFLPLLFLQAPELRLTPTLAMIPIVNVALMFREAIIGIYQWSLIVRTLLVEVGVVALALALAVKILQYENFVLANRSSGVGRLLMRELLRRTTGVGPSAVRRSPR